MQQHTRKRGRRLVPAAALGLALTGLLATSVSAATIDVGVNDNRTFTPRTVTTALGNSVHWSTTGVDDHSVTQDRGLFASGVARSGFEFTRKFSAGTFPYHCTEHGDQGMRGVVRVAPSTKAGPQGLPFTVAWAARGTNTGSRFDVQYRVGSGAFKSWMRNTTARSKVFGARNQPVRLQRGKTYSFRVVSRSSASVASATSPVTSFRAR
jgi:plastocyanin